MPDIVGGFCINTMLTIFHTVMELVMLPASVGYLMPKRVRLHWCLVEALLKSSLSLSLPVSMKLLER